MLSTPRKNPQLKPDQIAFDAQKMSNTPIWKIKMIITKDKHFYTPIQDEYV